VIVTTHPSFTKVAIRARRQINNSAPVYVAVTDLSNVHALWFNKEADITFVPTGNVYKLALDNGLEKTKVRLSGLPVHPAIARETRDKAAIRRALGWDETMITALIVGSTRSREISSIAQLLDRSGLDLQIGVVAGGNTEVEQELRAMRWKSPTHIFGFVNNMPELMHATDFIVCKAGGLIVTEALACGVPMILHDALPGQEMGNARYIADNGAGAWAPGPIGVLTTAYAWLAKDRAELNRCSAMARKIGKPRAAYDIAGAILRAIEL
jgi:1,2-diacylglycerol 3-beta-galactosyltransferase